MSLSWDLRVPYGLLSDPNMQITFSPETHLNRTNSGLIGVQQKLSIAEITEIQKRCENVTTEM